MLRKTLLLIALAFVSGCGSEVGEVDRLTETVNPLGVRTETPNASPTSADEGFVQTLNAPSAPSWTWTPDAITIDELVFPYAAKQAVGLHDVRGDEFRLATCEVIYRSRRVRQSEENNRWVRLSTGRYPHHATHWTHDGVPQFLYIFLNFETESDFGQFGVGTHTDVPFEIVGTHLLRANTYELTLRYVSESETTESEHLTPGTETQISTAVAQDATSIRFTATKATDYFYVGSVPLNGVVLTGVAYDRSGLTLRAAIGRRIADMFPTPLRLVLTQRSAPTRDRNFGRRIEFTRANINTNGRYAYIRHTNLSREQSKDLRLIGEDIRAGDIFHVYVYNQ